MGMIFPFWLCWVAGRMGLGEQWMLREASFLPETGFLRHPGIGWRQSDCGLKTLHLVCALLKATTYSVALRMAGKALQGFEAGAFELSKAGLSA
jgi:hypothetical protein